MNNPKSTSAEPYVDKAARCGDCPGWVERIRPAAGSQGMPTWRHMTPADHPAKPVEGPVHCQFCPVEIGWDGYRWLHLGDVASAPHPAKPKAVES